MITRLLADSVRLFATSIPLALITGWPYALSILVIGLLTVVYTYFGGIKAVIWVDALQMFLYLVGAAAAAVALSGLVDGGWAAILAQASDAGKLQVLDFGLVLSRPYTFWAGLVGSAFLTMGSHGVDQIIVQRLLTCKDLRASQKALVGSGIVVMAQFVIFLMVGMGFMGFLSGSKLRAQRRDIRALHRRGNARGAHGPLDCRRVRGGYVVALVFHQFPGLGHGL